MDRTLDEQKNILRKYLLHDLDEDELEQVEVRLLTDTKFSRLIAIAQNDLIDDFVSAQLSERELKNFNERFLTTPERLQKVKFATALDRYVSEKQPTRTGVLDRLTTFFRIHPLRAAGWATALFLVFGATLFIVFRAGWFQSGYDQRFQEALVLANRFQRADVTPLSELRQDSENAVALSLGQNLVREGEQPRRRVEVHPGVTLIRLLLEVPPGPYDSYNIVLQTVAGKDIAATGGLGARSEDGAQFVVINLPAEFLPPNDYRLKLIGISAGQASDIGLYPFEVAGK